MPVIHSNCSNLLAQIEAEKKKNLKKWITETSKVKVNPNLCLDRELQDFSSPIHTLMKWKKIETLPQLQECLESFCETFNNSEKMAEKEALEAELLFQFPFVPNLQKMILDLYNRIFDQRVKIKKHLDFPNQVFMVDLTFMPENFFYDDNHEISRYYKACLVGDNTLAPKMKTSHMRFGFRIRTPGGRWTRTLFFPAVNARPSIFTQFSLSCWRNMPANRSGPNSSVQCPFSSQSKNISRTRMLIIGMQLWITTNSCRVVENGGGEGSVSRLKTTPKRICRGASICLFRRAVCDLPFTDVTMVRWSRSRK